MNDDQVLVYNFWLGAAEGRVMSTFKATRHVIVHRHGGDVIESTQEAVGAAAIDEVGAYRRQATGWGGLD